MHAGIKHCMIKPAGLKSRIHCNNPQPSLVQAPSITSPGSRRPWRFVARSCASWSNHKASCSQMLLIARGDLKLAMDKSLGLRFPQTKQSQQNGCGSNKVNPKSKFGKDQHKKKSTRAPKAWGLLGILETHPARQCTSHRRGWIRKALPNKVSLVHRLLQVLLHRDHKAAAWPDTLRLKMTQVWSNEVAFGWCF